jgi:hypothetical protein
MKRLIVAGLVRLYPSRWRAEYGEELADVLMRRPLGAATIANVAVSGAWQQVRLQEPWLLMGVPLLILTTWYWIAVFSGITPFIMQGDARKTWWMGPATFALAGFWTRHREGRGAGWAAMKVSAIATLPFFVAGLLLITGFPVATSGAKGQWWFSVVNVGPQLPDAAVYGVLLSAPLFQLPFAGLFGWLGGLAGRVARRALH